MNEISASLKLEKGTINNVYYVKEDKTVVISTLSDSVKIVDENNNEIYEGLAKKDIVINLDKLAKKQGCAGFDPSSIPKITVVNELISISYLGKKDMTVKILG